ncbi:hypothetical protein NW762_010659 [Fusarium torreyae]|uniref:FAD dependent oxidoreductase domain-containing protein n=1 Tax=Fusarium torreyae TaxID=1237075 RepID=A0A9W8VD29_9HYPO|nr:hypothetical protein NW762_010659 [Fusarium torreyae]
MEEFMEYQPPEEDFWFKDHVPNFRVLDKKELPKGVVFGMTYTSIVATPNMILPWLRKQLEDSGVKFKRANVTALLDLDGMGHDILINATGVGTRLLKDVKDTEVIPIRSQTVLVRTNYDKVLMRHGADYSVPFTYVIPRGDGTAILGGFRDYNETAPILNNDMKAGIFKRVHQNLPHVFSADPAKFDVVRDVIGIHRWREVGIRVEREELNGQKGIHAAIKGGGYICSFGVSKIAADLVNDIHLEVRQSRL